VSPQFNLSERLDESRERGVGVNMPDALHERIEQLCEAMRAAGHRRPSKREMLSAIVLTSPVETDKLAAAVDEFHRVCVRDALVECSEPGDVVEFPHRGPGPRSARSG
jgi:hypothetical protein